jgi:hypothetical protein
MSQQTTSSAWLYLLIPDEKHQSQYDRVQNYHSGTDPWFKITLGRHSGSLVTLSREFLESMDLRSGQDGPSRRSGDALSETSRTRWHERMYCKIRVAENWLKDQEVEIFCTCAANTKCTNTDQGRRWAGGYVCGYMDSALGLDRSYSRRTAQQDPAEEVKEQDRGQESDTDPQLRQQPPSATRPP